MLCLATICETRAPGGDRIRFLGGLPSTANHCLNQLSSLIKLTDGRKWVLGWCIRLAVVLQPRERTYRMEREVAHAERQACRGHLGQRLGRNAMTRPFQVREQYIKGQVLCEAPCPGFVDADTEAEQGSYNQRVVGKEQIQVSVAPKATHLLRLPRLMLEAVSSVGSGTLDVALLPSHVPPLLWVWPSSGSWAVTSVGFWADGHEVQSKTGRFPRLRLDLPRRSPSCTCSSRVSRRA